MKIAITADKDKLHSTIDQRFGRCKYFIIIDFKDKDLGKFEIIKNKGSSESQSAGISAAEQIVNLNVEKIITGRVGPKALRIINNMGIKVYRASGEIINALKDLAEDKLEEIKDDNEIKDEIETIIEEDKGKEEIIFFPLITNEGIYSKISQHFGHAPFFGIYNSKKKEFRIISNTLDHKNPDKSPIDQIKETSNPTTIFAKGIGERAIKLIQDKGIKLKTGNYSTVAEVIDNFEDLTEEIDSCGHEH